MPQAVVDPEEVRRFAKRLKQFSEMTRGEIGRLHSQVQSLGASWRDQEHQKFMDEFERTVSDVNRFLDAADEHVPFLLRKAQRADDYLQQR
ncbi:hypothetical protein Pan216_23070 [Planctomycetes bacterium Pan216]|uniref:WXG100 family type VII secretion target n=1 Tax=Kolteria novifilia TaxID=2527975 RepID=A0A518B375_9BACT|nr:hypothetical protein Pan216_23070 [Planctomycetes bacterium Pan216]